MSFGIITKILNETIILLKNDNITKKLNIHEIEIIKQNIYNKLLCKFKTSELNIKLINEIFERLFTIEYKLDYNISFENGNKCFREFENTYNDIIVLPKYIELEKHFNKLKLLPQPVQRTKEWFDYRYNRITASDTAAAIDLNPYEPVESFILKKCDPDFPFRDNVNVFHGKKYEPVATLIYEHIYNNRVFEFGALPSEKYIFLGASPDGICSKYTLDNKFSERLGTMLEIKCPVTREIITKGKIIGEICPFYYYCQIQQQLECCELDICDFWQCKLVEYKNKTEYLIDKCVNNNIYEGENNDILLNINSQLKKGIIIEFYPKKFEPEFDNDNIEWKSKYIVPSRLDMSESEYDNWVLYIFDNYQKLYPDIYEKYYFNKIIYWKLDRAHNVMIKKNNDFLQNIIPILENTWNKIVYYRKNKHKLQELRDIAEQRKKYIKINTNFKISNEEIIKDKLLFLNSTNSTKKNNNDFID